MRSPHPDKYCDYGLVGFCLIHKQPEAGGAEAGDAGGGDEEEKKTMKRLEKGDYVIQVHIIEARELKARDAGDTSDPVCEVEVMGQKKSSAIHKELSRFLVI